MSDSKKGKKPTALWVAVKGETGAPAQLPKAGVLVIGSSQDKAGLVVEGQGVAPVHCAIGKVKGGGWAVKDMGSEFGTVLNGEKITSQRLERGDTLILGSKRLQIQSAEDMSAQAEKTAPKEGLAPEAISPGDAKELLSQTAQKRREEVSTPRELGDTSRAPVLGGYRVETTLGRGAMGKVFLAVQESLDRRVALKVLPPKLAADAEFVKKFQAEARAAAALGHPNVVIVHDVGEQNGFHYLSMEYMERGSVEDRLNSVGKLEWPEALEVLRDAAAGLVYAESRGIVHRDIKPANLMQNATGATKIADLGLAGGIEKEAEEKDKRIFGTPHFISPEQARGETVDARSDLYSLGATAYQLLSGVTPFQGETSRDILRGHLLEEPTPLAERVNDVPRELAAVVERLMRKKPEDRFPTARALLDELERLRATLKGSLSAGASAGQSGAGAAGKKGILIGVGVAVLAVLAAVGAFAFLGGDKEPENGGGLRNSGANALAHAQNGEGLGEENGSNGGHSEKTPSGQNGAQNSNGESNGNSDPETNEPGDAEIRLFEIEAENALLRLGQTDLADPERIERLNQLAFDYDGTKAAAQALSQAESLQTTLQEAAEAEALRVSAFAAVEKSLVGAADLERTPPAPGEQLTRLNAVVTPAEFTDQAAFNARREELQREIISRSLTWANQRISAAEQAARDGDRETFGTELRAVTNRLALPAFEADSAPPGLSDLRQARLAAEKRLTEEDAVFAEYATKLNSEDAKLMISRLAGPRALEAELRALDFDAAIARIDSALAQVSTNDNRQLLEDWKTDLDLARDALRAVGSSFAQWKRQTVFVPSNTRSSSATVVRADPVTGLGVENGSKIVDVPWSDYATHPRELDQLFSGRLERSWTANERRGIAALLLFSATMHAAEASSEVFYAERDARFSKREAEDMLEGFSYAAEWASGDERAEARLEQELRAATLLRDALRDAEEDRVSAAVSELERLLVEYSRTLLVLFYSKGA